MRWDEEDMDVLRDEEASYQEYEDETTLNPYGLTQAERDRLFKHKRVEIEY